MPALSNCLDPHFLQPGRMWRTTNIKRQRIHKQMYNHTANHYKIWTLYKPLTFVYIHTLTHNCIKKKHNIYIYLLQHVYLHTSYINQTFIVYYIYTVYTHIHSIYLLKKQLSHLYIYYSMININQIRVLHQHRKTNRTCEVVIKALFHTPRRDGRPEDQRQLWQLRGRAF